MSAKKWTIADIEQAIEIMMAMHENDINLADWDSREVEIQYFDRKEWHPRKRAAQLIHAALPADKIAPQKKDATEKVFKGYTEAELSKAFDRVADPADWKRPILKRVPKQWLDVTIAAIEFYTSTQVKVTAYAGRDDVTVESIGYRAGPAGDH